jgi:hypothetical protein
MPPTDPLRRECRFLSERSPVDPPALMKPTVSLKGALRGFSYRRCMRPVSPNTCPSSSADSSPKVGSGTSGRVRIATIASLLGALGILLAACSSGPSASNSSSSTSTTRPGGSSASFTAYENCLKSHGASFPTGGFGGPGSGGPPSSTPGATRPTLSASQRAALQKAMSACSSLRPSFGGGGAGSTEFAAYRNCLKLHGVTLPTGRGSGGFGGFGAGGSTSTTTTTPAIKAAEAACASLRPKGGFGGRPPTSTTTTS